MNLALAFGVGVVFGAAVVWLVFQASARKAEARKNRDFEALLTQIRASFDSMSLGALGKVNDQLITMAQEILSQQTSRSEQDLESKKKLIGQDVETMRGDLRKVQDLVRQLENDRQQKFGELTTQLKVSVEQTSKLQDTTEHLRQALGSTKARGQWGERMAEDVLTLAGFKEGFNYLKQKTLESAGSRPDYTFLLPQHRTLNMDVKFPLDNYLKFLEAGSDIERDKFKVQFLRDVRTRIKEVGTREYINPEESTLDYVLVFIPNEQVYAFIHENDRGLLDSALKNKVILCSPITLYAVLAVIRQGMANFAMERTASLLLGLIDGFEKQFGAFVESFDKMGKKLDEAQTEFKRLESTRRKQLDRSIDKIKALREEKGLGSEGPVIEGEAAAADIEAGPEEKS